MPRIALPLSRTLLSPRVIIPVQPIRTATNKAGNKGPEDVAVNRTDANDVQSQASQSGMQQKQQGKEGSQGISGKDEGNFNKKAKEDHPEAPEPVIGMNDERAQVSRKSGVRQARLTKVIERTSLTRAELRTIDGGIAYPRRSIDGTGSIFENETHVIYPL